MNTFQDFCKWIGSQRRAASVLGRSEAQVSRIFNRKTEVTKEDAEIIEAYSLGLFKKEAVLWPDANDKTD